MDEAMGLAAIQSKIIELRGVKVMLDRDLAALYRVETKYLVRQYKRNKSRFPSHFAWQLSKEEWDGLRCQNVTLKSKQGQHRKYAPYCFTEQGTLMLASVLKSTVAIDVNINIIVAFVDIRKQVSRDSRYLEVFEKIKHIESRIDTVELAQRMDAKLESDKLQSLGREVQQLTQLLDDFQDTHVVIKRPEAGLQTG